MLPLGGASDGPGTRYTCARGVFIHIMCVFPYVFPDTGFDQHATNGGEQVNLIQPRLRSFRLRWQPC